MKLKKIVCLVLGLALMLSLGTVAFADEVTESGETTQPSTYSDQTTVIIEKVYKIENVGTTSPAETFTVEQVGDGCVTDGDATTAPALGTIAGAVFAEGAATTEGAKANITITLPTYTTVGVYEYTLKEAVGTTAGVVYHSGNIKLVVTVMKDADGTIRVAAVHTEAENEEKSGSITNVYRAAGVQSEDTGLKIMKTISGNMADPDKYFEFTVSLTGETGKTYAASYAIKGGSYTSNPTSCTVDTPFKIYLKAGETITIENLPYGVTYTVDETDYNGYTTKGEVLTPAMVDAATESVTVNNEKSADVDTGIYTDTMPYILLLAVVAVAAIVFFSKKRYAKD